MSSIPLDSDGSPFPSSEDKTVISKRPIAAPSRPISPLAPGEVGRSLVGETLGHFQLEEFVGGGGMGAVFRAVDTTLGRTVAVKVVSNQSADEEMLRRFGNEAQSAARLDHPNIARVYYVGAEKGWSYIVFEFIEGVNIRDLVVQRGPLPISEAISYTLQIADALEHAADRDVVHRDIKPSNILVMPDGRAKLVDMGLARLHQVDSPSQDLTETGVTLGTFDYISPEQARDPRSADVRSDLYSLGCTLYFMLTGMPPFPEGTVLQKLLSHSSDPPPDPRDLRVDLDDDLSAVTLRLMAKLPGQRFATPGELIDRLLAISDRLGLNHERRYSLAAPIGETTWSSLLLGHLPWIIPGLLLVAAVFGLELVFPRSPEISHDSLRPFVGGSAPDSGSAVRPAGSASSPSLAPSSGSSASPLRPEVKAPPVERASAAEPVPVPSSPPNVGAPAPAKSEPQPGPVSADNPKESGEPLAHPPAERSASGRTDGILNTVAGADSGTTSGVIDDSAKVAAPQAAAVVGTTAAGPVITDRLVVSPESLTSELAPVVPSMDAAFQKLASMPQVETIELRFRQRLEKPLTLAPRSRDSELTIRAGDPFVPLIIFRPPATDSGDRHLIKVIGGSVHFVGIHFRVELPNQPLDGWSLFHLKDTDQVSFTNCTFTIRNDRGVMATFFSIDAPAPAKMTMPTEVAEVQVGPLIDLKSCVIRGDAHVVRAVSGMPFRLNWKQGFLATSRTAVLASGLRDADGTQLIQLTLSNITGSLGEGLCLIDVDSLSPVVPDLRVQSTNCVWLQHNPDAALVEHRGIEDVEPLAQNLFRYAGEQNLYPQTRVLWRIQTHDGEVISHRWREPKPGIWYVEGSVDKGVRWRRSLPSEGRATDSYSFRDFLMEPELANMAGFSESFLPEPREPDPESNAATKPTANRYTVDIPL